MGRPNEPTKLKLIKGNAGKRAINGAEPDSMLLVDLTPPAHLRPEAAEVWRQLAPKYARMQVLTEADTELLEMACDAIASYRRAAVEAEKGPVCTHPETGSMYANPWVNLKSMYFRQAMAALREFGGSPSARARLVINPQGELFERDELARYIRQNSAA